jgi:hypothetical protein
MQQICSHGDSLRNPKLDSVKDVPPFTALDAIVSDGGGHLLRAIENESKTELGTRE